MQDKLKKLWAPSDEWISSTNLVAFQKWLETNKNIRCTNYKELYEWSINDIPGFWEVIWEYFNVRSYSDYYSVMSGSEMPGIKWFEGATLNYAEHLFRHNAEGPAIIFQSERHPQRTITWSELKENVASLRAFMQEAGVGKGDRVVAFLPNCPEAITGFIAACSLGAIWSSCSPDFGVDSVLDRFSQIEPKLLITCDGYSYNGKPYSRMEQSRELVMRLDTLQSVIWVPFNGEEPEGDWCCQPVNWDETQQAKAELAFEPVPFDHPIWVLYSSGTTGKPKAITHSHGGCLLEHLKYLAFHNDVHLGEKFFWYSTTGWMMWNFSVASMLMGATVVLYDGSPGYPDLNVLWKMAEDTGVNHFGTSAPFIVACMKKGLSPGDDNDLSGLRSIGSTGAPLPPEGFDWVYDHVKKDLWLCSMSGGTDVCTAFVGGCPTRPVYEGEIQCRALGCALYALDEEGQPLIDEVGEMVIAEPMPSMPVYFWNDPGMERYKSSYFEEYPGKWRHGDWIRITDRDSLIIYGRSDATLNRQGVRIGTAEIYSAVDTVEEVEDALIVNLELSEGRHYMPLFVKMKNGLKLTDEVQQKIKAILREKYSPRHVPDEIVEVTDIPYTISGKKMEAPVKKILLGMNTSKAANKGAMRNPVALEFFREFAGKIER